MVRIQSVYITYVVPLDLFWKEGFSICPPAWIRTKDRLLKRELLYQAELRAVEHKNNTTIKDFLKYIINYDSRHSSQHT